MEPKVGNCSPNKPLMTVDSPAPFIPTTATQLTCDTGSRPQSWACPSKDTEVHARYAQDDLDAAPHVLKETRLREGEIYRPVAQLEVRPFSGYLSTTMVNVLPREGIEPVLEAT